VVEEIDRSQADLDFAFKAVAKRALSTYVPRHVQHKGTVEDKFKSFRTKLVAGYGAVYACHIHLSEAAPYFNS